MYFFRFNEYSELLLSNESETDGDAVDSCLSDTEQNPESRSASTKKLCRNEERSNVRHELVMIEGKKVIVSLDLLVKVFASRCEEPGCTATTSVSHRVCGTGAIIQWKCDNGHHGKFFSSHEYANVFANNLQTAGAVILSGINFTKLEKFATFLGLEMISSSTFHRMQRLYCIPAIQSWWEWQRGEIFEEFVGRDVVLSGDGQCDSPGRTAKNLCYFLLEIESGYVVSVEILDKRHTGGVSTNMERKALQQGLNDTTEHITVAELITDASTTVQKMMGD